MSSGTLLIDGSQSGSAVTVSPGAILGGTNGTVGAVTVAGGAISPGAEPTAPGILNSGSVAFSSTAAYAAALNNITTGSGYSQLDATGAVNLGTSTALNITIGTGFTPTVGTTFTIIQSPGAISGAFASDPEGTVISSGGQFFRVSYQNDDVTLTTVAGTTSTVGSSLNSSVYGQSVSFTDTVSNIGSSGGVPTGSVEFFDGSTDLGPGTSLSGSGTSATSTLTISTLTAGNHPITAVYTSTGDFQGETSPSLPQTVTPAALTITANGQTKLYGAVLPALTVSYSGFVNGDTSASLTTQPTISTTASAASHVAGSPYPITASGAVDSNYTMSYVGGSLTITPVGLTITAVNKTKAYGAALPSLTATYAGFVSGDSSVSLTTQPTLSTTATASSHVAGSPYTITASGAVDADYTISYVAGSMTVTAVPLTITASNQTKVYGRAADANGHLLRLRQ